MSATEPPADVLAAWGWQGRSARHVPGGLINLTFQIGDAILQRLHPIFGPEVNLDLDAVTRHLAAAGLLTPRLVPTRAGDRWLEHQGAVWRALSFIDGVTLHTMPDAEHARASGRLVGQVHRALADFDQPFAFQRAGVHDTPAHLARLTAALEGPGDAPAPAGDASAPAGDARHLIDQARTLGRRILAAAADLPPLAPDLPRRVCHGDLKVSNILFAPDPPPVRALCLIDLDTLGRQTIAYEMGDALRSWCNPAGEDTAETRFDLDRFAAAVRGYAAGAAGLLGADEVASILPGLETVCLELAARFCADVFEDRYFGWNPDRFGSRREHNLVRARGQLALGLSVAAARAEAGAACARAFAGPSDRSHEL